MECVTSSWWEIVSGSGVTTRVESSVYLHFPTLFGGFIHVLHRYTINMHSDWVSIASLGCESEVFHKNLLFFILKHNKTDSSQQDHVRMGG